MLTYTLDKQSGISLYEQLYRAIRADILDGTLSGNEKLPSKRVLSAHLEVSVVTVKTAYEQLIAEGYIYGVEKKGYFVTPMERPLEAAPARREVPPAGEREWFFDFAASAADASYFPFTTWAKLMRRTILEQDTHLLAPTPSTGAYELRQAIAQHLHRFRGMSVSPEQVIVGAGTEVLYYLLVQLLGREKCYGVEEPGYGKIGRIYRANGVSVAPLPLDDMGLSAAALRESDADVVHISPSHHYPTGIVMPISRRRELLKWAGEQPERYILEDDYDSELRFNGRPIPTLYSVDEHERVIYLNTFSKTIAPSIRISYMVLPPHLLEKYRRTLGFYACTVSGFEQYTLAEFIARGSFEQHLNRLRKRYHQKRDTVMAAIRTGPLGHKAAITEHDAGLHFLVTLDTALHDDILRQKAAEKGLKLAFLSDYYGDKTTAPRHVLIINYSGLDEKKLPAALARLHEILEETPCTTN